MFRWTDPPDGLSIFVKTDARPGDVVVALTRAAGALARTRCHAGVGHTPGIARGAFGELCAACWVSVRRFLGRGTVPPF